MKRTTQNKAKDAICPINIPLSLLKVIDEVRGETSRSRFIRGLILEALENRVAREKLEVEE